MYIIILLIYNGLPEYGYIYSELNLTKTTYALRLCRCPCGNVLQPKHETPKPESIQNIYYPNKNTTHPTIFGREQQPPAILEPRAPALLPGAPGPQVHCFDERELHADTHPVGDR